MYDVIFQLTALISRTAEEQDKADKSAVPHLSVSHLLPLPQVCLKMTKVCFKIWSHLSISFSPAPQITYH